MTDEVGKRDRSQAYGEALLRFRWIVIAISLSIVVVCGVGLGSLSFDADTRLFFGEDNPELLALNELEGTYDKTNNVLIVLEPLDGQVFSRDTLSAIETLTELAWQTPQSVRVNSITNYPHSYAKGDEFVVEELVAGAEDLSDADLDRIRTIALGSPDLVNLLISEDGDVASISILVNQEDEPDPDAVFAITDYVRAISDQVGRDHPNIKFHLTGGVLADMTFAEAAENDIARLVPIMIALIAVALGFGLRSVGGAAATMLVVVFSVVTALGVAGWVGLSLNAATAAAPVTIMTLSVANCVHLLTVFRQRFRRNGTDKRTAILESIELNVSPIIVTSLTTAIGFATLNFSSSPPFRELGNIVALGMVSALVYSLTFLPALLSALPMRSRGAATISSQLLERFADFVVARRRILVPAAGSVIIVLMGGLTQIRFDDDFVKYFDERYQFRTDTDFFERRLSGLNVLQYSVPSGEEQGIANPEYLSNLEAFGNWFRQQDGVAHVSELTHTIKRLNMNMNGDDPSFYRIPETRELSAQYLFLYEMSLPFGHDLNSQIDVARSASQLVAFVRGLSSAEIRELGAQGEAWLEANAPDMAAPATGLSVAYAYVSERNTRSMLQGTLIALVLISLLLLIVLRSVTLGLLSLVPNLVPAAMAFGLWGYVVGEVNLAVSVVAAITLGIVVDDTVHFLSKYQRARRMYDMDAAAAVRYSFGIVGPAMVLTSVALLLGFGVLALSGFAVSANLGLLSAITILFALAADFLFLPPLLVSFGKRTP